VSALLLGHRGDPDNHVENSLAGFAAAMACGADGVELDVQVSVDGEPFVIHDATLDRTVPGGSGRVDARNAEELHALGVPHLRDALHLLRDHVTAVELKPPFDAAPGLSLVALDLAAPGQRILLLAFDARHLAAARGHHPQARTALLTTERPGDARAALAAAGATMLAAQWQAIDAALCREVPVIAWTVDDEQDARRLLDMGVQELISNRPCALRDVVRRA
jgi:glycerophosphoryl diester phosphodiesterase